MDEMASAYDHPVPGDLSRVKRHHHLATNEAATWFLVERAVEDLGDRVEHAPGGYRLARPLAGMRYPPHSGRGQIVANEPDAHARYGDPFNPMSGRFSDNIRRNTGKDNMDELRESMRAVGWLPGHPAIRDERGVVLVGHRRLAVAKELGIEPEVLNLRFGDGDEADHGRLALAIMSNAGAKPLTPEERARIAEVLFKGGKGASVADIALALGTSKATAYRDLRATFSREKVRRPLGRPRKEKSILGAVKDSEVFEMRENGHTLEEVADALGVSTQPVKIAEAREIGRREVLESMASASTEEHACPICGFVHQAEVVAVD
jgi:transposase-like protein